MLTLVPWVTAGIGRAQAAALLAAGAAIPALLAGCANHPLAQPASASSIAAAARPVGVVTPSQADVARTITQPATLQGIEEAMLYAKAAGYLRAVSVDKGDRVRAGQVLAVIESPELEAERAQAGSAHQQSLAAAQGARASQSRAVADAAQANSAVERARADASRARAGVDRAQADLRRAETSLPKLQAAADEADAAAAESVEQQAQAQVEITRRQQQIRVAQAGLQKAEAEARLQALTYSRLKAIQDKDAGLVPAQDVDVARTRMEEAQGGLEGAGGDVSAAEQQVESARREAAAAARKVEAARSHAAAARQDVQIGRHDIEAARAQAREAQAEQASAEAQARGAVSQRRALNAQIRAADAQVTAAHLQSLGSRSALTAAAALASYTRLVAPFDGVVTERLADPGSFVQNAGANQAAARPIVKIVRDQTLRVLIPVPEDDVPAVHRGRAVELAVDAFPGRRFQGSVTRYASAVDPRTRTMLTEVDIPNPDRRLRPGMYTRATLVLAVHHHALSIPSKALMGPEEKRFVYTVSGGHAHRSLVTVGVDDGKTAEITSGLSPGTPVVVTGQDTLVDGAPVKAEPAQS